MTNVMKSAWEIAYEGVEKFGGQVKEYFSAALKIAWDLFKKGGKEMNYAEQVKGTLVKMDIPQLEGSEKQIAWAETIRKNAASTLQEEVMREEYEETNLLPNRKPTIYKRRVDAIFHALVSEEGIKAHFDEMKEKKLPESRFESTVESMNEALGRYERYLEILSESSAKFWIDNRDNQSKNHNFKLFIEYVNTGVKKF